MMAEEQSDESEEFTVLLPEGPVKVELHYGETPVEEILTKLLQTGQLAPNMRGGLEEAEEQR